MRPAQTCQRQCRHPWPGIGGFLRADALSDFEQIGAGARSGIEDRNCLVAKALGIQIIAQRPIERPDDITDHRHGRVVDTEPAPLIGVERRQEVFVEIQDRIMQARSDGKDDGIEAVDRVTHHLEPDSQFAHNLRLAQHSQRRAHQWVLSWHMSPRIRPRGLAGLADQQQTEGEGLSKGRREQPIEIGGSITRCFRVGIEDVAEFLPHLQQRVIRDTGQSKLAQPITNNATHEAGGMSEHRCEFRCVTRARRLSCR